MNLRGGRVSELHADRPRVYHGYYPVVIQRVQLKLLALRSCCYAATQRLSSRKGRSGQFLVFGLSSYIRLFAGVPEILKHPETIAHRLQSGEEWTRTRHFSASEDVRWQVERQVVRWQERVRAMDSNLQTLPALRLWPGCVPTHVVRQCHSA